MEQWRSMAYLEIGQGGGHMKWVGGTEVLQLGPEAELLGGLGEAPKPELFLECKLNLVHVIQYDKLKAGLFFKLKIATVAYL